MVVLTRQELLGDSLRLHVQRETGQNLTVADTFLFMFRSLEEGRKPGQ